jgi:hypothetical protein
MASFVAPGALGHLASARARSTRCARSRTARRWTRSSASPAGSHDGRTVPIAVTVLGRRRCGGTSGEAMGPACPYGRAGRSCGSRRSTAGALACDGALRIVWPAPCRRGQFDGRSLPSYATGAGGGRQSRATCPRLDGCAPGSSKCRPHCVASRCLLPGVRRRAAERKADPDAATPFATASAEGHRVELVEVRRSLRRPPRSLLRVTWRATAFRTARRSRR